MKRVFRLNRDGVLVAIQSNNQDWMCHVPGEAIGQPFGKLIPEDAARQFLLGIERTEQTHEPQFVRYQQEINGIICFFEARITQAVGDDFNISVMPPAPGDHELPSSTHQFQNFEVLISRLPGTVYRCAHDRAWTVLDIGAGIQEFLGYRPDDFLKPNGLTLLDIIYEPDRTHVRRLIEEAVKQNSTFTIEYRMVHADGSLRWVNEQGQVILDHNGVPRSFEGIIMDVTKSFQQRENTILPTTQLSSIGTLGAGVAHEINNALAIMMANLDYAVEELENVGEIVAGDTHLSAPLDDINDSLAKLGLGMKRIQKIVHDLRSYSDAAGAQTIETIDIARLLEWSIKEAIELTTQTTIIRKFPDEPVLLIGNQLGLLQVFTHLLSNAEKSFVSESAQNTISITLKAIHNDAILIEINDTGCGIPPEVLPRIFEPFFSNRPIGEGTGLGLFVCQGIVHSMNGEILISSTPDVGTSVQLILPTNMPVD